MNGAIGRIILRYGAGSIFGAAVGVSLSADSDLALVVGTAVAGVVGGATEVAYAIAKKKGWTL